ncbi:armadillo-type protein [Pilobolus umbonatus]|nr:armadillo-type protein [Pilobolus umbonatus]
MDTPQEDFSSLSIADRLQHKAWNARVSAYEDLKKLFQSTMEDSDFNTYESNLFKMVTDANAAAQEAGVAALIQYVSNAPNASSTRESIIPGLVNKCFGATKAGTKQNSVDAILLYAEIDQPDPVVELVIPGINAKQPKIVTQTVFVIKELVRLFGAKKVSAKPIVKILPKLFGHTDKNVRAEAFALTVELYRWIGQPMMSGLSALKPIQLKELEEAFTKLPPTKPTPERLIRSEQAVPEEAVEDEADAGDNQEEGMEVEEIDAFDLADPVDITEKLPGNFYELLASKKWQERKEAMDAVLEKAKSPKILDKDYSELINGLAKRINDSNILMVGVAASCIEAIATGLRTDFAKYKPIVAPPIVEKLKERKPAILEQLSSALNAVFASVPLSEIVEDLTAASKHKNPQVRAECFKLLSRRLKEVKEIPGKAELKAFAEMFKKLLDDADANAREAAAEGLGTMMKLIGEKPMLPFTDGLDDIKMGKIKEACEKAVVKAKVVVKKPPPPPVKKAAAPTRKAPTKAAPKATPKAEPMNIDDDSFSTTPTESVALPKRKPPPRLSGPGAKKPALSSSKPKTASTAAPPKKSAKLPPPSSGPEEIKYRFSQEDAEARATEFIPENLLTELQQSQWKARLGAMESLCTHFESEDPASIEPEIVIRSFSKKPGWKEMNFQVMSKMFYVIQILATQCPKFTKACGALCIPAMVEKLGDIKLKKPANECLVAISEKISLQFVLSQAYPVLKKAKSPKVLADSLLWIHAALMDFGIYGLQVRDLIDLLKFGLSNTNASVRTSSVTVLGALRQYIGPEVKAFVEDVSPALLATIESEFERVANLDPPQPSKAPTEAVVGTSSGGGGGGADSLDSLFPRVDISGQLNKTISACGDANWKIRKEGLDKVLSIISEANNRIKPSLGTEFPGVLKQRLNDSNKNLQISAVEIAGLLALAMGDPFDKYVKTFTGPVIQTLSDNKANVRAAGITTLENFRKTCKLEGMLSSCGTALAAESPSLRKELLTWLSASIKEEQGASKYDFSSLITPLFSCLQDRNADVRKAAQACLPEIISVVGYDAVASKTSELKAAQRQTVMPLIEAARGSAPASVPASSAPSKRASAVEKRPDTASSNDERKTPTPSRMKLLGKKKSGLASPRATPQPIQPAADESSPPVLTSDPRSKQVRAKKEIRWAFETPRPDVIEALKALFDANMSPEVTALLFSNSQYAERDRLNGMTVLNECISSPDVSETKYNLDYSDMKKRYVANADLILKYLTIRFFDTNTSMLIKSLDITQNLIAVLDEEEYHLSEYEAVSFLPFLINKLGDPKEIMRTRIRTILKAVCRIYPASKVFNYLLDSAANSKNAKARAECLEEVGSLIQRNGISVMLPNKALPLIATHIGDRDAGVRNAALNGIAQAYILMGDPVMKYVTRLGEKEKGMLEERLKRTKPSASVIAALEKEKARQEAEEMEVDELPSLANLNRNGRSQIGKPRGLARPTPQVQVAPEPEPMEDIQEEYVARVPEPQVYRNQHEARQMRPPQSGFQQHQQQAQLMNNQEDLVAYIIAQITSGDPQPSIEALKQLDKLLTQNPEVILHDITALINAITLQVKLAYTFVDPRQPAGTRLCKHLVNALVLIFSNRDLAYSVSQDSLHHLLQELAARLLDQKMLSLESGPQLSKALNVAMVKVLENSNRNVTFSALLSILGTCSAGLRPGDSPSAKDTKYTELIMKCLWKLAKTIQDNLRTNILNADELLYEINEFFIKTPPTEWKRRASDNIPLGEMPLRTVKTLLLELVNGLGDSTFQHLTLIEDPQRSSVYPYLHHMLEACRKKEMMQQQKLGSPIPQPEEVQNNQYLYHSRNSSLSRPGSVASMKSNNNMMRTPSMGSYPSNDGANNDHNAQYHPPITSGQSPRLQSPLLNNSQVQPMQIDSSHPDTGPKVMSDLDLNNTLTKIFVKIGTRDKTKQVFIG